MADPVRLPAAVIDQATYVAVAIATDDADTDILAGVARHIALENPELSAQELAGAIDELQGALAGSRPSQQLVSQSDTAVRMRRSLSRVVPSLSSPLLRSGARAYSREFLASHRRGTDQLRQVAPIDLQFDRFAEVERFREDTWRQLHQLARTRPAVAQSVDQSPIGVALGIATTEDAATILGRVKLEPLNTFVGDRLQPGGSLIVSPDDVDAVLIQVSSTTGDLTSSYAANLVNINGVEQAVRDLVDAIFPDAPQSELAEAIAKAEKKQQELDEFLKNATTGVKGTLGILAGATRLFGDAELAGDIEEYASITVKVLTAMREFSSDAIATAKFVEGVLSASFDELLLGGGAAFSIAIIAAMIQVTGLLGNRTKPVNQVILEALRTISEQIVELHDEMRVRFDRVERRLNRMYLGLLDRLAEIDFDIGQIEENVDELQLALYDLHGQLQRLNRDLHAFLDAEGRRPLVEAVNGFLNFEELTGQPLNFDGFLEAENMFFSWGHDHAKDALQAGAEARDFSDDGLLGELTSVPLATNINYLRQLPAERFGLPPLSTTRLANPFDWIVAGESYAQLSEESPDHADQLSPNRIEGLIAVGETLGESLARIADNDLEGAQTCQAQRAAVARLIRRLRELREDLQTAPPLEHVRIRRAIARTQRALAEARRAMRACRTAGPTFAALAQLHRTAFGALKDAISVAERDFRDDVSTGLHGIDLWDGAEQTPNRHFFRDSFGDLERCGGGTYDDAQDVLRVPPNDRVPLDHSQLVPYLVASNLSRASLPGIASGLRELSACVAARWTTASVEETGLGGLFRITYRLSISLDIRYGDAIVFTHRFDTPTSRVAAVRAEDLDTFNPATDSQQGLDPHTLLPDRIENGVRVEGLWAQLEDFPATHNLINPALRAATVALVERKLVLLQRAFYDRVARRFARAGDAIQISGDRFSGSKLLWQSFVTAGLPLTIDASEILRSLLFGSDAILGGTDADADDALLDDIQDIYTFVAVRQEDPPATNILPQLDELVENRTRRLLSILGEIVDRIESGGEPEPPELFAPTLLRLSLIAQ